MEDAWPSQASRFPPPTPERVQRGSLPLHVVLPCSPSETEGQRGIYANTRIYTMQIGQDSLSNHKQQLRGVTRPAGELARDDKQVTSRLRGDQVGRWSS